MADQNSIGRFRIGIDSIGIYPFDWHNTLISQYANSPVLQALIQVISDNVDPTRNIDLFFDTLWNLDTAQGYGLDVWGRIVGVNRVLPIVPSKYLGFEEATDVSADPFGQSPLYNHQALTSNYALSDSAFRLLILAKAASNITDCSVKSINAILRMLFPAEGVCYVTDNQDMTMTYTFGWLLTPIQVSIIVSSGVLPRTAGVAVSVVQM